MAGQALALPGQLLRNVSGATGRACYCPPMPLREQVATALSRAGFSPARRLLVACSGGADSVTLADAVVHLHRHGRVGPVALLHVDHRLRPDSAAAADKVRAFADRLEVDCISVEVDVDRDRASLEEAARIARYDAFENAAAAHGDAAVLLGHTASDQAETVLMRLLRGCGPGGICGIPVRRGRYFRPLLSVSRAAVEEYVAHHRLPVAEDPSNRDLRFFRNRVRHRWLPALVEENPNLEEALCRLAAGTTELMGVVQSELEELRRGARRADGWHAPALAEAPPAVAKALLGQEAASAGIGELGATHLDLLLELVRGPSAGTRALDLPGGRAVREYDTLRFGEPSPGESLPELPDALRSHYIWRVWQVGDRMRPVRLKGRSKKLSDLFTDAKVPRERRRAARVLVERSTGNIVWAEHIGLADESDPQLRLTLPAPVATNKH